MNKYLLLRDNKQSGPFTVPEIIEIGIKPYDLVWLDGKSAAWRYPSELEELKQYAPTVEEQPFDRFYKRPEAIKKEQSRPVNTITTAHLTPIAADNAQVEKHEAYLPKTAAEGPGEKPSKKVYITFPANLATTAKAPAIQPEKIPAVDLSSQHSFSQHAPIAAGTNPPTYSHHSFRSDSIDKRDSTRIKDNKTLRIALAACILLGIISGILFYNYKRQTQALNELNTIVRNIENAQKQQQLIPSARVENSAASEAESLNPPATTVIEAEEPTTEVPAATSNPRPQPVEKKTVPNEADAPVVFTENKPGERPVERRDQPEAVSQPSINAPTENLYALVEVKPNAYKTGLLGGISNLKFNLTNNSQLSLHRVALQVKFLGPEKKVVKTQTIYFENIAPGGQSTVEVPKSNRGVTVEYTVTDIKS